MKLMTSKAAVEAPEPGRRERQRLAREERSAEAMAAAERRSVKGRAVTLTERIKAAQLKLDRPLARARELLDDLSDNDLQVYLLAEELDKNRKGVLQGFPAAGAALRAQYDQEAGAVSRAPDEE